ncbi:hypothetical protein GCM10027596_22500 [Nocardioides korecus]
MLLGLVAAASVLGGGYVYESGQPVQYSASNQLLIAPGTTLDSAATSSYWETLSNGQIPATAAAIVSDKRLERQAVDRLPTAVQRQVAATVSVVPSTAVVNVQVVAPSSQIAEQVANQIATLSVSEVSRALSPYELRVISDASGTATLSSLSSSQWLTMIVLAALFVGIVVQQLASWAGRATRRRRGAERPTVR